MLKAPGAELCRNACGERTKIFSSYQCSSECSMNIYIYTYIYILKSFHIYPYITCSSNIFFFNELLLLTPWVEPNFFLPIMIKGIHISSICLGQSFTLTSSNNNLWVLRTISVILKTKSIAKYSKVLQTHDYYHISNHCPLFRLANTLKFSGS